MTLCKCHRSCLLTAAERYRANVRCRYKHGKVQPVAHFVPPKRKDGP